MNIEHKLYPYPVLTYFNDDYLNSIFMAKVEVEKGIGKIGVSLEAVTDDLGLLGLINDGYAEFVFRIECLVTLYREIVKWVDANKKFLFHKKKSTVK